MQDFLADRFQCRKVGIQKDKAQAAAVGKVSENIDKTQMREHGKNTDAPGILDSLAWTSPTKEIVLVGVHLDVQERLTRTVCTHKFLV